GRRAGGRTVDADHRHLLPPYGRFGRFPAGGGSGIFRTRPRAEEAPMETVTLTKELEPKVYSSLGQCPLFRALKPEQLPQLVKVAELQRFEAAETIVKQGERSAAFFVLIYATAA